MTLLRRCCGTVLVIIVFGRHVPAAAQEVFGTVQGTMRLADGSPAGGIVALVGTSFWAESDAQGRYRFDLVPAGAYVVTAADRVSTAVVSGVSTSRPRQLSTSLRVRAGETVTLDLVFQSDSTTTLPGDLPLTSGTTLTGDDVRRLGVDDPRFALAHSPGVAVKGGDVGITSQPDISVRGDEPGEAAAYLDGAPIRFQTLGREALVPSTSSLYELGITTGVSNAFAADGRSAIGYVTRTGGNTLQGDAHLETDAPFGDALTAGYNRFEGSLGGPLPGLPRLRWFASASLQGQQSAYRGAGASDVPYYVLGGIDTIVQRNAGGPALDTLPLFEARSTLERPLDWLSLQRYQGRLLHTFGRGASLSVTGLFSDFQQRFWPGNNLMADGLYSGQRLSSRVVVINWGQPLGRVGAGPLSLEVNASLSSERGATGPLTPASEAATRDPALGFAFGRLSFTGLDIQPPVDDAYIEKMRNNAGPLVPYENQNGLSNAQPARLNPYGLSSGWPTQGIDRRITRVTEQRASARARLRWRPAAAHDVTFGADFDRASLTYYDSDMLQRIALDAFEGQPRRLGVFVGDQFSFGDAVLDVSLRYDRFSPGGEFPVIPGRIFTNPAWDINDYAASVDTVYDPAHTQSQVSPRLRFGYRLSPGNTVRFAFGQQVELPGYAAFFSGSNSDLAYGGPAGTFGDDVDFAQSTLAELGFRHAAGGALQLDAALYYKKLAVYTTGFEQVFDPFSGNTLSLPVLTADNGRDIIGGDAGIGWRASEVLSLGLNYSLQKLHAPAPNLGGPFVPPEGNQTSHFVYGTATVSAPAAWTRSGAGSVLRDARLLLTVRAYSGAPYTSQLPNAGIGIVAPFDPLDPDNPYGDAHLPWTKIADLRLTKGLSIGGRRWTVFADIRNLLDTRNLVQVFAETGTVVNDQHRAQLKSPYLVILQNEAGTNAQPNGTINLANPCSGWNNMTNCVSLRRVEQRFGDGDGQFTVAEQEAAFDAFYDQFTGPSRFSLPGRTVRIGFELTP